MSVRGHESLRAGHEPVRAGHESERAGLRDKLASVWEIAGTPARVLIVAWALLPLVLAIGVMRLPWHAQGKVFWEVDSRFVEAQPGKASDARTKADVGTLGSLMEDCFARRRDFAACDSAAELPRAVAAGIELGSGPSKIEIAAAGRQTYELVGVSQTGGRYVLARNAAGRMRHTCAYNGVSPCGPDGTW
jgi:hypothetical protein